MGHGADSPGVHRDLSVFVRPAEAVGGDTDV